MSNGHTLYLHLGLRFGFAPGRQICSRAVEFLEEIERLEAKNPIPLYWNFPVGAVLGSQSRKTADLIAAIRRRIRTGEDRIIPSGFSLAPHPLLLPEELRRELSWCYRNPWFPALKQLFDAQPEIIIPLYPDLYSEAVENAYSGQGFTAIGIPIPLYRFYPQPAGSRGTEFKPLAAPECTIRGGRTVVKLRPIAVLRPEEVNQGGIEAMLSACGKADTLYTMLDLADVNPEGDAAGPAAVGLLLHRLSRHRRVELRPFSADSQGPAPTPIDPAKLLKFVEPLGGCSGGASWDEVENLRRKKRKSNLQIRDLLNNVAAAVPLGPYPRSDRRKNGKTEPLEITNISMTGSVTLIGIGLQATFSEGRLSNLIDHGNVLLPGEPGRSVLTLDKNRRFLQTNSAFSFDRKGQTGLRSILSGRFGKKGRSVQVILDYYFADEHSGLAVDIAAGYPSLGPGIVGECTPLELCLCSFGEDDSPWLEVQAPEREPYRHNLEAGPGVFVLSGKWFRLHQSDGILELQAAPLQITRSEQIEFRVERKRGAAAGRPYSLRQNTGGQQPGRQHAGRQHPRIKPQGRGYLLWVNLGGSYLSQPAENLSDRTLNLSYAIRFIGSSLAGKRS